jgi:hypothetical protein
MAYFTGDEEHLTENQGVHFGSGPKGAYPMGHFIASAGVTATPRTIRAPFDGGDRKASPKTPTNAAKIAGLAWAFYVPPTTAGSTSSPRCTGDLTISDLRFYGKIGEPVVVSTENRSPRTGYPSVNYWQWMSSYGDAIAGTETQIAALKPATLRVGGYNNDANMADAFDNQELDRAVAYARAIGAEPMIQVPLLADTAGLPPTAATAAAMVTYANVTKRYGIKYFSVGNEPDLYATQGGLKNSSEPAIPQYAPSDYCTSVRAYVTAMKAVDPTIQIVGPDLSWKYPPNWGKDDWLTPILKACGDMFDVIAIHRYPFDPKEATLEAARSDASSFAIVISAVRGVMKETGYDSKPLAVTEMNITPAQTLCVLDASPGTLGSALWLADSLGTSMDLGLWTAAVWDIGDGDEWSLGLLSLSSSHTPRPPYWAYSMYADHFGPTMVNVMSSPKGVAAHASRNQSDNATEIIAINWNRSAVEVPFQVTGLATAPAAATFVLPPTSMTAVKIPDNGAASAWVYGEAQRRASVGPQRLTSEPTDGGISLPGQGDNSGGAGTLVGTGCPTDGGIAVCPTIVLPQPTITVRGSVRGKGVSFGSGSYEWISFPWAGSDQKTPTVTATEDGKGMEISATVNPTGPDSLGQALGVGLQFMAPRCINASSYTGVKFDVAGDLGGCRLYFGVTAVNDIPRTNFVWGTCSQASCWGPFANVVPAGTTVMVPFSSLGSGSPVATLDPSTVRFVQWNLGPASSGPEAGSCTAKITISNVSFY